ncbi:MAG: flavodoxin family protein [Marinifilaceae bacterium]|jgi:multimeric flavodoxin WrbA|nr:flavodoxin family protein [Marinifilaceae bacterium]
MKILGISASPVKNGVLESAINKVLESTEADYEMIRLTEKQIKNCIGCVGCAKTNKCIFRDDMDEIIEKFMEADAVVLGAVTRHSRVNALMQTLLERFFPLYHMEIKTAGKPVVLIANGLFSADKALENLKEFATGFQMKTLGAMTVGGNASCYKCGLGLECPHSAHVAINGRVPITQDTFYKLENDAACLQKAVELGNTIRKTLEA